jgi:hypothetical protein
MQVASHGVIVARTVYSRLVVCLAPEEERDENLLYQ